MAAATLKRRVERLEKRCPKYALRDIPPTILDRVCFLHTKWFAVGDLEMTKKEELFGLLNGPELTGISGKTTLKSLTEEIRRMRTGPGMRAEEQALIDQMAELDLDYKKFATEVT